MKQRPVAIKMRLALEKVPAHEFIRSIRDFFEILEEVTNSLYGTPKAISWSVMVERGSNVLAAIPENVISQEIKPRAVSTTLRNGLKVIKGGKERPEHFSDRMLEKIKSLADLSESHGEYISIATGKSKEKISAKIRTNIDNLLRCAYSEVGTVEGNLRILAKRKHFEVEILDEVSEHLIRCTISPEQLEDAKDAFNRRVSVTGLVHYKADGTPISIEVKDIFRFPFNRELPHHSDLRGIFGEA
jgi:hypothetical protein